MIFDSLKKTIKLALIAAAVMAIGACAGGCMFSKSSAPYGDSLSDSAGNMPQP